MTIHNWRGKKTLLLFTYVFRLQIETVGGPTDCQRKVQAGDHISIDYRGTLDSFDGFVFDSSYQRNQPFNVQIGVGKVVKGWDQGIVGMCVGEKRRLVIPPELGYGSRVRILAWIRLWSINFGYTKFSAYFFL